MTWSYTRLDRNLFFVWFLLIQPLNHYMIFNNTEEWDEKEGIKSVEV